MKEKFIPADKQNFDRRQRFIILHYTVSDEKDSVETLRRGGVGAHFLIPKQPFQDEQGETCDYYRFVDIEDRTWHAGFSNFAGRNGLNDTSIGIEIVNYGYGLAQDSGDILFTYQVENQLKEYIIETLKKEDENLYRLLESEQLLTAFLADMQRSLIPPADRRAYKEKVSQESITKYKKLTERWRKENDKFLPIKQEDLYQLEKDGKLTWDEYTDHQINTIVKLIQDIQEKLIIKDEKTEKVYYQIAPPFITGHADIAPGRKTDPGPRIFEALAKQNTGAWPDKQRVATIQNEIQIVQAIDYRWIQNNLSVYGYKIEVTGHFDEQTQNVIRVFQMHFEPENYSGVPNVKTISILEALIEKYFPDKKSEYPRSFNPSNEKKNSSFFREVSPNSDTANTVSAYNCCVIS